MCNVLVVGVDFDLMETSYKVVSELFEIVDNSKEFLIVNGVIEFCFI